MALLIRAGQKGCEEVGRRYTAVVAAATPTPFSSRNIEGRQSFITNGKEPLIESDGGAAAIVRSFKLRTCSHCAWLAGF